MTISPTDVQVGKFFVNSNFAREIVEERAGEKIVYYTYLLKNGAPLYKTSDIVSKSQIAHTAQREATLQEISLMKTHEARSLDEQQKNSITRQSLARYPIMWSADGKSMALPLAVN
ncbi:MAG: hypothetical protein H7Y59_12180 [Anaerolineales bacterium]|nr:hypothetical protein [Anaerolineales bacterium]